MQSKNRSGGIAADAARALPTIRRVQALQSLLAIGAIALTMGSAIVTKRLTADPAPLASMRSHEPSRELRGIPAASVVPHRIDKRRAVGTPLRSGVALTDPLPRSVVHVDHEVSLDMQRDEPAVAADPRSFTPATGYERYYNGRPLRRARTMWMTVTAYSPDHRSCGKYADGITASGMSVWTNGMQLVAADPAVLPRHSLVSVPGYADDSVVPVLDVGGAIKGSRLDVLYPSHAVARQWGVQRLKVTVWEYADE